MRVIGLPYPHSESGARAIKSTTVLIVAKALERLSDSFLG